MNLPQPPEGILDPQVPWSYIRPQSPLWNTLKARLTGRPTNGEHYSSYVNLTEADADRLIENLKKDPRGYPSLDQESGTPVQWMERQQKYQEWLVEEYLEKPFREEVDRKIEERQLQKPKPPQLIVEQEDTGEIEEQVEEATEVLEEAQEVNNQEISAEFFDDIPPSLRKKLVEVINKKTGKQVELPEDSQEKSSGTSNAKIYRYLTLNLSKIQNQLETIDAKITEQNALLKSSISVAVATYEKIELQDAALENKFDSILQAIEEQNRFAKELQDKQEDEAAKSSLQARRDVAGTEGFADVSGKGGLFSKLLRFFGKKLAKLIWKKLIPRKARAAFRLARIKSKLLAKKMLGRATTRSLVSTSTKAATSGVAKGFEHIALPGVTRAATQGSEKITTGAGQTILERALRSKAVQGALAKKLGKEGAEKLTVKLVAKLVPGVSTAYGLGEGLARIAMGDVKGGFLSFGSALPFAGWGFAAVDILRDIDTAAYTKHIEPNLPAPKEENFKAFFAEALGVKEDQYEIGSKDVRPGTAMLHGTEWVGNRKEYGNLQNSIPNTIGSSLLTSTASFVQSLGSAGSTISPELNKEISLLAEKFGVNPTMVSANVGGSFSNLENKVKEFRETEGDVDAEFNGLNSAEKSVLKNSQGPSFKDRILSLLRNPFDAIKDALSRRGNGGGGGDGAPYTGPISGETFNPLPGGSVGTGSGQVFGASRDGGSRKHAGVDVTEHKLSDSRAPIVSYKTGKIVTLERADKYPGGAVEVDHGGGLLTRYLHVTPRQDLKVGDTVYGGQQLGKLHRYFDGSQEQTHLHFEVYQNGKLMNPTQYVSSAKNQIASPLSDDRAKEEHVKASGQPAGSDNKPTSSVSGKPKGYGKIVLEQDGKVLSTVEYFYMNGKYYERTTADGKTTTKEITESIYKAVRKNHAASFGLESYKEYTLPSSGEVKQVAQVSPPSRSNASTAAEIAYTKPKTEGSNTLVIGTAPQPQPTVTGQDNNQYYPSTQSRNMVAMRLA